jgi:DNA-binding NtrC family response regulator
MDQRKFRILLLDDAPHHREEYGTAIKKIFQYPLNIGFECEVTAVADAEKFKLAIAELGPHEQVDLAIVDQKISRWTKVGEEFEEVPGSDNDLEQGPEIVKKFARHPAIRKLVVLTQHAEQFPEQEHIERGASEFWLKTEMLYGMFQQQIESIFNLPSRYDVMRFAGAFEDRIDEINERFNEEFLGTHPSILKVKSQICEAALSDIPVLIIGETGTGKEEVANLIHRFSKRGIATGREKPIPLNCAEFVEEELLRAELFGYAKGAFTGAAGEKKGRIQAADGSTLFLDEVGLASPRFQAVMLRAVEDGKATPVGGTERDLYEFNLRLIAATDQDVFGSEYFSKAFLHRLSGMVIKMPPLRERKTDIRLLVEKFMSNVAGDLRVTFAAWQILEQYDWPGNVRQLKYLVDILSERFRRTRQKLVTRHDLEYLLPGIDSKDTLGASNERRFESYTGAGLNYDEVKSRFAADYVQHQHEEISGGRRSNEAYSKTAQTLSCSVSTIKERLADYRRLFGAEQEITEEHE